MAYEVLARKWRPKNFFELAGQDSVRQTLLNGLKQKRIYPVLLFTGPRGTGKTSTARILAKNLRCQNQKDFIPCNKCEDCLLIQNSRHLDVIEIDGASNNGVEAVRDLRDTIAYMPSSGHWKIYIIDEVHMLSNSAFNALLKTFEEPPSHVLFIMATTESRKIPETVLSRVQRLDFHLLSPHLIKNQLEKICKEEKFSFSEEVLWLISKQARGSLRDAQSLLDQVVTFCGQDVSKERVTELLGLSDPRILSQALKALIHRQSKEMISVIENLRLKNPEPRFFLQSLLESLRSFLFLKKNPENNPELVQASQAEVKEMKKDIADISYEDLHFLFDSLLKGEREMAFCHDSQLALEVLLLRFCDSQQLESFIPFSSLEETVNTKDKPSSTSEIKEEKTFRKGKSTVLKRDENSETEKVSSFKEGEGSKEDKAFLLSKSDSSQDKEHSLLKENDSASYVLRKTERDFVNKQASLSDSFSKAKDQGEQSSLFENGTKTNPANSSYTEKAFEKRFDFLNFLKEKDGALSALVENLRLKEKSPHHFCFIVPENFSYLKNKVTDPHCHKMLEDKLTEFLHSKERVKIDFTFNSIPSPNLRDEKKQREEEGLLQQAQENPFVKEVKNLFEGEIRTTKKP